MFSAVLSYSKYIATEKVFLYIFSTCSSLQQLLSHYEYTHTHTHTHTEAYYLGDIGIWVPDHSMKAIIQIKIDFFFFWFASAYRSYVYTLL